ncbi:MAG: FAD-dependent oxidoreductase [Actinobacteria bacterium]|nr:FAD-dependent oxidoreductase [Actinomycetota bacterium]
MSDSKTGHFSGSEGPVTHAPAPSFWLEPEPRPGPALAEDLDVDVAIVGAGYTGLSAALALRERGASVAVIERDYAGFGASGRNAGHLTPTIGKDVPSLLRFYGRRRARLLVALADNAVEHTEHKIAALGIDCDYVPSGNVLAGVHSGHESVLEKAATAAREAGAPVKSLSPADMRERDLPRGFTCGYIEERGGVLQPAKYVRGLREAAVSAGVKLYEDTPVQSIENGTRVRLITPGGTVSADKCIVATNAFTSQLGMLRSVCVPIIVSMFATAPLTDQQRERIGWPGREGVYTAHEVLESYRLSADGRLVGGSRFIGYFYGNGIPGAPAPGPLARQERMFRARFPELADAAIEHRWSGPTAFSLDFLPAIGRVGTGGNILYSIAYAGHGVAMASFAGDLVGTLAAGEAPDDRWDVLLKRRRPPMPPEPARWAAVKGITAALEWIDRRTDRRAARERGAVDDAAGVSELGGIAKQSKEAVR